MSTPDASGSEVPSAPLELVPPHVGAIASMARNSVAANVFMAILLVGGLLTLPTIKQEVFPEFTLDQVNVTVVYPGAAPTEVEQGAVLAIEEAVRGVEGIEKVVSVAGEGRGSVTAEIELGRPLQRIAADIESAIDRITSFAKDVERPVVSILSNRREVLSLVLHGNLEEATLRELGERLRDEILQDPRITQVDLSGVRPYQVSIEIPQETLRRYGLTLDSVAAAVRNASIELPAGGVKTRRGEILVRTSERRETGRELAEVVLRSNGEGSELRLGDLARIRDGFAEVDEYALFDGEPALALRIFRIGGQTPLSVAAAAHEFLERKRSELPQGVGLDPWNDSSEAYRGRVELLSRNAGMGLALVLLILGMFLDLRLAFWITMGIPVSFCGAFLLMPWMDVTINMISLFAFILTLGIVVDDAIVVGEAIYALRERGIGRQDAAIGGALEVAGPVTFSVLTTVIAFLPLLFVPEVLGKIMRVLPAIVIAVLSISLFESMFILPAHLAHTDLSQPRGPLGWVHTAQGWFAQLLEAWVRRVFSPFLHAALRLRYVTLAVGAVALILTGGLVAGKRISFVFLPRIDAEIVTAELALPFGASVDETRIVVDRLVRSAREVLEERGGERVVGRGILAMVGATLTGGQGGAASGTRSGSHLGQVQVFLVPEDRRNFGSAQFGRDWRERMGSVPGIDTLKFKSTTGPSGGADIDVELSHSDREVIEAAAERLAASLAEFAGVHDIDDGVARGKEQLDLELNAEGRAWGLTEASLANAVRGSFFGHEAQRLQRGRHEVRTYVRLPESERRSEADISGLLVLGPRGAEIPLPTAATLDRGFARKEISRRDGRRVLNVTAEVDDQVTNAGRVLEELEAQILPDLMARFPGLRYSFAGAQESRTKAMAALRRGFALAMIAMFALLAIAFSSYFQPVLIMLTIPFGIASALHGHLFMGMEVSLMSMFGMVALSGVVVNDSIVLISAMNAFLGEGMSPFEAVHAGAVRRFRPILLTSLTTFLGLAPMLLERSLQARWLIPMAVSLGVGVLFATAISLIVVPAAYLALEDLLWCFGTGAWCPEDPGLHGPEAP